MSFVLVVDDKEMMRDSVGSTLRRAGFEVSAADGAEAALRIAADRRPDAVVTDLKMPGMTGIDLLEKLRQIDDELPVILMTAFGAIETAVQAIRLGAFDYITKPFEGDELVIAVKRALRHGKVVRENAVLKAATPEREPAPGDVYGPTGVDRIIGCSPAIRRVKEQVLSVAASHGTVLVCGESGTGKEVISRAIHEMSPRSGEPYLAVNCAALSEGLLESELFGHERGAFTGADKMRKGRFELADRGTLLLDEVSEVGQKIQAKLLRVLQERAFERVGSSLTIGVDVRVVATSNRDLPAEVASGEFRQDLFFRLNVLPIHLPALRDRSEDVELLAEHFTSQIASRDGRDPVIFEPDAMDLLRSYRWPGNVRELHNVCERAAVLCEQTPDRGPVVTRSLLEPWLLSHGRPASSIEARPSVAQMAPNGSARHLEPAVSALPDQAGRTLEEIEREVIIATLRSFDGHRQKTAKSLGIGVRTLGLKLKKWKEMALVEATL
ncbi:MAG: sigma-54 dependent transcriptional regulator [Planctomycetota bacterium]